jgi:hypothetical protein
VTETLGRPTVFAATRPSAVRKCCAFLGHLSNSKLS